MQKTTSPDKIKGEILKWFKEHSTYLQTLTLCQIDVINKSEVPDD